MKMSFLLAASILVSTCGFTVDRPAYAATVAIETGIPNVSATLDDRPKSFSLKILGGAVAGDAATAPRTAGVHWPVDLLVTYREDANGFGLDSVLITGNVHHETVLHPNEGEGRGRPLSFSIVLSGRGIAYSTAELNGISAEMDYWPGYPFFVDHAPHRDRYDLSGAVTPINNEIFGWSVTLQGAHAVPLPPALPMLISGLGALVASGRRRFAASGGGRGAGRTLASP